jgi:hypothetical protein
MQEFFVKNSRHKKEQQETEINTASQLFDIGNQMTFSSIIRLYNLKS